MKLLIYVLMLRSVTSSAQRSEQTAVCVFRPKIYEFPIDVRMFPAVRRAELFRDNSLPTSQGPRGLKSSNDKKMDVATTRCFRLVSFRFILYRFVSFVRFISFCSVSFRVISTVPSVPLHFVLVVSLVFFSFIVSFRLTSLTFQLCRQRARALSPYPWERWRTTCTLCYATEGECYEYKATVVQTCKYM